MPVIWRGNHHRVDVLPGEQFAEVIVLSAAFVAASLHHLRVFLLDERLRLLSPLRVHVAHRSDLRVRIGEEAFQVSVDAVIAGADEAERDAVAGSNLPRLGSVVFISCSISHGASTNPAQ